MPFSNLTPGLWYSLLIVPPGEIIILTDGRARWFDTMPTNFKSVAEWLDSSEMKKKKPVAWTFTASTTEALNVVC